MTNQHPITPPPELIKQWISAFYNTPIVPGEFSIDIATKAAQWGSDQELEACCAEMNDWGNIHNSCGLNLSNFLRAARRPKPLSLKEQALSELEEIMTELHDETGSAFTASAIRRALEALPND